MSRASPTWLDISWKIHPDILVWPGDPAPQRQIVATVEADGYATSLLTLPSHTGTHLDAPAHFVAGGMTVDQIALDHLCGEALVLDLRQDGLEIGPAVLAGFDLSRVTRILLRTSNESLLERPFTTPFAHLTEAGAWHLLHHSSVRLVGIDYASIELSNDGSYPVHQALLGAPQPVFILEGLDLRNVQSGVYELACLPLPLAGADASPCRAALRRMGR